MNVTHRIADTNVFYNLASRTISASKLKKNGKKNIKLVISPISIVELFKSLDNPSEFQMRQAAAQAAFDYADEYTLDSEIGFAQIWDPAFIPDKDLESVWRNHIIALAFAEDYAELLKGVSDPFSNSRIIVDWEFIATHRKHHYDDFCNLVIKFLDKYIPGYKRSCDNKGTLRAANQQQQNNLSRTACRLPGWLATLISTRQRTDLRSATSDKFCGDELIRAADALEVYSRIYGEYLLRRSTSKPEPNDLGDLECFAHVREGYQVATSDNIWHSIAEMSGMSDYIYLPEERNSPQQEYDAQMVQRETAYLNWLSRGKPKGDSHFDWFAARSEIWRNENS